MQKTVDQSQVSLCFAKENRPAVFRYVPFLQGNLVAQKQPKKINNLVWKFEYVYPGEHLSEKELEEIIRTFSEFYYGIVSDFQKELV